VAQRGEERHAFGEKSTVPPRCVSSTLASSVRCDSCNSPAIWLSPSATWPARHSQRRGRGAEVSFRQSGVRGHQTAQLTRMNLDSRVAMAMMPLSRRREASRAQRCATCTGERRARRHRHCQRARPPTLEEDRRVDGRDCGAADVRSTAHEPCPTQFRWWRLATRPVTATRCPCASKIAYPELLAGVPQRPVDAASARTRVASTPTTTAPTVDRGRTRRRPW